jgi:hypothetical protein
MEAVKQRIMQTSSRVTEQTPDQPTSNKTPQISHKNFTVWGCDAV